MDVPSAGDIVVLPFPFSDLSESKSVQSLLLRSQQSDWFYARSRATLRTPRQLSSRKLILNQECCGFKLPVLPNFLRQTNVISIEERSSRKS